MSKPIVAIVGRQNVGKSTLLNRVAGKPLAIVEDQPGTTRDRVIANASWAGVEFTVVDTAGLEIKDQSTLAQEVRGQVQAAISDADLILFLVDAKDGVTPADLDVADLVRKASKPHLLVANKADNPKLEAQAAEFYQLGLGEPMAVSAYHGRGTAEMLDRLVTFLPPTAPEEAPAAGMKVAIVGRPNVGKSMLLNALVGKKRAIVHEMPGTTRDALDTIIDFKGQNVLLIDTAGIRRRGRVGVGVEYYSVIRALRAIDRSDVALLVLDATEISAQDTHIAGYIQQAVKGVVLIVNKWDIVEHKDEADWTDRIRSVFKFMTYAPIIFISAKEGLGVHKVLPQAHEVYEERSRRVPTSQINAAIQQAIATHNLPRSGKKQLKVLYVSQTDTNPPTFTFFVNDAQLVHFSYRRFLENQLRQTFGFSGTPLRLVFKARGET